jgi:GNAT superfamily N-acetyltransferase
VVSLDDERQQGWEIRPLDSSEVEAVGEVLGLARLHQGDGFYLVAWQDVAPIGHLHLALSDPPELQDVAVRPSHQRRGVATALVAVSPHAAAVFEELSGRGDPLRWVSLTCRHAAPMQKRFTP